MTRPLPALIVLMSVGIACAPSKRFEPVNPNPLFRCYTIRSDTGRPQFLVSRIFLGTNNLGSDWQAAAVGPDRIPSGGRLGAQWRRFQGDSVDIEWFVPGTVFGPVGILIAKLSDDSLHGRAAAGSDVIPLGPWVQVYGRRDSCPSGA